jgi:hypothetical protein
MISSIILLVLVSSSLNSTKTDAYGYYSIDIISQGKITPSKTGDFCNGITALDASWILQYLVGKRQFSEEQLLACDTNGDGVCSSADSSKILQFLTGKISRFPAGILCNSDWLFVPTPQQVHGQTITNPNITSGVCVMGSIMYSDLVYDPINNQNFKGILIGDVTGDWTPCQ